MTDCLIVSLTIANVNIGFDCGKEKSLTFILITYLERSSFTNEIEDITWPRRDTKFLFEC